MNAGVDQPDMACDVPKGIHARHERQKRGSSQPVPYRSWCNVCIEIFVLPGCMLFSPPHCPLERCFSISRHVGASGLSRAKASGTMSQAMDRVLLTKLSNRCLMCYLERENTTAIVLETKEANIQSRNTAECQQFTRHQQQGG